MKKLIFLFFLFPLFAESYYEHSHIPKDLSFLNLNKSQQLQIKDLIEKYRKRLKKIHNKEEIWEENLKIEFSKKNFNYKKLYQQNLEIRKKIAKIEMEFFYEVHKILNAKQRKKFAKYIEEWEVE
ncbi:hypothetical protein JCM11957_16000 [Caminibacter profundus]